MKNINIENFYHGLNLIDEAETKGRARKIAGILNTSYGNTPSERRQIQDAASKAKRRLKLCRPGHHTLGCGTLNNTANCQCGIRNDLS